MKNKFVPTILVIFVVLSVIFWVLKSQFNFGLLMTGNVIMATLSLVSFLIINKQLRNRPEAFVRGVYASSFLRLFVCMIGILTYAMINRPNVHKPSLFMLLGIYAVYSAVETILLSKMARNTK